jgi:hypothetical protein
MNANQTACLSFLGIGAIVLLYVASTRTEDVAVPKVQVAADVMGFGAQGGLNLAAGTPLDGRPCVHFWDPGWNPRDANPPHGVVTTKHRYPAIPGGNVSTVMHHGWSRMAESAPADDDWRLNPPEAAVL